ncbi:hypothetical protein [Mycobacterium sp. 48b]|uniref:hypothetical protein n=1 Tax=Mycobacterium sp. 48b TaxID=3400426 RepID=UPI003AABEE50
MKRIYLDQNMWIELSRVRLGSAGAKKEFVECYELAKFAAAHGLASFVLSQTHMYETQKRQDWNKRLDVVETMIEISRLHAIRHVTSVVPMEADFAIGVLHGYTSTPPNIFGFGIRDMLARDLDEQPFPRDLDPRKLGYRESFVTLADRLSLLHRWDVFLLAGAPPWIADRRIRRVLLEIDLVFAADQSGVADKIKAHDLKGGELEDVLMHYTLSEVRHELFRAASERGIPGEALVEFVIAEPASMLRMLPSRHVVHGMYMQHAQRQKDWKPNDLHDITAE